MRQTVSSGAEWEAVVGYSRAVRTGPGVADDPDGMLFPHLYGPIPIAAVRSITAYRPGQDGLFGPAGPPST